VTHVMRSDHYTTPTDPYTTLFRSNNDVKVDFEVQVPAGVEFNGQTVNGEMAAEGLEADVHASTVNGSVLACTSASRPSAAISPRSEEHTSELQSPYELVCRLLLEK